MQIFLRLLSRVTVYLVSFFLIYLAIHTFVVAPARINGRSMEPRYVDDQLFFVNKFIYLFRGPKRYDVVQLHDLENRTLVIKRVLGVPGETIVIKGGYVYVRDDGGADARIPEAAYLDEHVRTYVSGATSSAVFPLGDDEFFVLGDNRDSSVDSRHYGPVIRTRIIGRVL